MKKNGFTLIEVLVASTIFVVLMTAMFSSFRAGILGGKKIDENLESIQAARLIMGMISRDIRNSFVFSEEKSGFSGTKNKISFYSLVNGILQNKFIKHYALVTYSFNGNSLKRICLKNKDSMRGGTGLSQEGSVLKFKELSFSYAEISGIDNALFWKDDWTDTKAMPVAVKIRLVAGNKSNLEFERTVFLSL
jgi:prepilin-type N-terminal cleavage/methylation domain-containing protein